jgi:thioredoxin-dependent peroxiredoxin
MLPIGTQAPRVQARDGDEKTVRLADFLGESRIVLFFYPGDFTQYCTKQACILRDNLENFRALECLKTHRRR